MAKSGKRGLSLLPMLAAQLWTTTFAAQHHHLHLQPKPRHGEALPLLPPIANQLPAIAAAATAVNATAAPAESCLGDAFRYGLWLKSPSSDASSPFKQSLKSIAKEPAQNNRGMSAFSPFCGKPVTFSCYKMCRPSRLNPATP